MTDEERNATGNETPSDGELPETEETQAPESESREPETEPDWKRKYLDEGKPAQEEANRLRREIEDLRRAQQPPAAKSDDADDDDLDVIEYYAKGDPANGIKPDPIAKALIRERRERDELVRGIVLRDQLRDIDNKDEREAVKARFDPRKHRDIRHAHEEVRQEKTDARLRELEAENARLKAGKPGNPNVTRTLTRDVPAAEHAARRNESDAAFKSRIANLDDDARRKAMMERRTAKMG